MRFLKLSFSLQLVLFLIASYGWSGPKVQKSWFRITSVSFGTQHILQKNDDVYDSEGNPGFIIRFEEQKDRQQVVKYFVVGVFNGIKKKLPLEEVAIPEFKETRDNFYVYGDSRRWSHLGVFENDDLLITSPAMNSFGRMKEVARRVPRECITSSPNFGYEVSFEDSSKNLKWGHLVRVYSKDQIEVAVNGEFVRVNRRNVKSFDGVKVGERVISNSKFGFVERTILGFSFEKAEIGTLCAVFSGVEPLPFEHIAFTTGEKPVGLELGLKVNVPELGLGEIRGWYRDGHVLVETDSGDYAKVPWNRRLMVSGAPSALSPPNSTTSRVSLELDALELPETLTDTLTETL